MTTYFSDFATVPDTAWIGADECFPLLSGDEQYGSRAALDRYFSTLSALGAGTIDVEGVATCGRLMRGGGVVLSP